MANLILSLEKDIKVGAEDFLKWVTKAETAGPQALAGLGVLAGALEKAFIDAETAAANPAQLILNLGTDIAGVKAVWPAVKGFLETLGVKV